MIGPEVSVAPDFTEPVIGYRQFILEPHSQHNFRLMSPHQREPWLTQTVTARCNAKLPVPDGLVLPAMPLRSHSAPHKDCGCGIYAYFEPCPVPKTSPNLYYLWRDANEVAALVTVEGRVEVHAHGMRAQRATIQALGLNGNLSPFETAALKEIGRQWDVPVVPQDALPEIAVEYGRPLDKASRPGRANPIATTEPASLDPVPTPSDYTVAYLESLHAAQNKRARRFPVLPRWALAAYAAAAAVCNLATAALWGSPLNLGAGIAMSVVAGWEAARLIGWRS